MGWCLQVPSHGMGSMSWAVPCCSLLGLSCPLALSHMVSSSLAHVHAPLLWHFMALSQVVYHSCSASGQVLASVGQPCISATLSPGRVLAPTLALQHPRYPSMGVLQPVALPGLPQGNVPGGHKVFRKTGLGSCWPYQENKNIWASSRRETVRGWHSINPLEQVLCSRHKEMSILFSLA